MILELFRNTDGSYTFCVNGIPNLDTREIKKYHIMLNGYTQTKAVYVSDTNDPHIRVLKYKDRWPSSLEEIHDDRFTIRLDGVVAITYDPILRGYASIPDRPKPTSTRIDTPRSRKIQKRKVVGRRS